MTLWLYCAIVILCHVEAVNYQLSFLRLWLYILSNKLTPNPTVIPVAYYKMSASSLNANLRDYR